MGARAMCEGVPVWFYSRGAQALYSLLLALAVTAPQAMAQPGTGVVMGTVRDSSGAPLASARLELTSGDGEGGLLTAESDSLGHFHLGPAPAGPARLGVRHVGFHPGDATLEVVAGQTIELDVTLHDIAQPLAPLIVTRRREVYDARLSGFFERQARGVGHFIGPERIARSASSSFTDILRAEVPGVRIGSLGGLTKAVRLRGSRCPPLVFLDGFPASAGEFDVDMIELGSLEGIEVYNGLTSVPPEFIGPRMLERCGVIAVWTRPTPRR